MAAGCVKVFPRFVLSWFLVLFSAVMVQIRAYKPIIIIHGIFDHASTFDNFSVAIKTAHPGTNVTIIDEYTELFSLYPMWEQVRGFQKAMAPIMQQAKDGVHIICYSQGGLICRGVLESMDNHNVDTFISLSSPLMGQYGDTDYLKYVFPHYLKENLYKVAYTSYGQDISISNYWNDPHHQDLYKETSVFLAVLNNQTAKNDKSVEYKNNFLKLKKLVLIGGPDDGVITPWQSSHFAFYDANETVVEMKGQEVYQRDYFGLKTMDARGDVTTYEIPGVQHLDWHKNQTVFDNYIEKWLT
ncbi:PPT2 [Branchiostoma lanceolatum]|uniref:palmitoyl-CoA hydrolase n=2 Tax=Branchiostoma lanceolatum TaxID=7740 RepID=A0A8K0AD75_BRALA|nr:PPT2 [Branchiostoma lanceolatum]